MVNFGSGLYPPGCTGTPYDDDEPCDCCGLNVWECNCICCPVCKGSGKEGINTEIANPLPDDCPQCDGSGMLPPPGDQF